MSDKRGVVYVATCATAVAGHIGELIELAQQTGWETCLMVTPQARNFVDEAALERQTGYPVRHQHKLPGSPAVFPNAHGIIVAGASFNTVNKWALGIADNLVLSTVTEAIGLRIPIVLMPFVNEAMATHLVWQHSLATLRSMGVIVLDYRPHQAGTAKERLATYPWRVMLETLEERLSKGDLPGLSNSEQGYRLERATAVGLASEPAKDSR